MANAWGTYAALDDIGHKYINGDLSADEARQKAMEHLTGGADVSAEPTATATREAAIENGSPLQPSDIGELLNYGQEKVEGASPDQKGRKTSLVDQITNSQKHQVSLGLVRSPDQARMMSMMAQGIYPEQMKDANGQPVLDENKQPTYDLNKTHTDPNHPIQQQIRAQQQMADLLKIKLSHQHQKLNLDPLGEFLDRIGMPQTSVPAQGNHDEDQQNELYKELSSLMKAKGDIAKEANAGQNPLKGGTAMDSLAQVQLAKFLEDQNNQIGQTMQLKQDFALHRDMLRRIDNDPSLKTMMSNGYNLRTGLSMLANAGTLPPSQLLEAQNLIRRSLGITGQLTGDERQQQTIRDLGLSWDGVKQFLTGKLQDVRKDHPELLAHIADLAKLELQNAGSQFNRRLGALQAGADSMYARHPDWLDDMHSKVAATAAQNAPLATPKSGGKKKAPKTKAAPADAGDFDPEAYLGGH